MFVQHRAEFVFSKTGKMKYISHLDLMRLFMRALRRAELPVMISQGFNPHPKISLQNALKLGAESDNELAKVVLHRLVAGADFQERLQSQLPQGILIRKVEVI
ncbi:MAG: TIGR03936 family radical SAM-associated protein [Candidatus Omnitrophota bacterium]|nr:TIGR03936 family radical SAM-associated protein [Candidatus Omnitrophota bacterium]